MIEPLKVRHDTDVKKLASAIMHQVRENKECRILAIGAGAINQAVKAWGSANGLASASGISLMGVPFFTDVSMEVNGESVVKTGILIWITTSQLEKLN